MTISSPSFWVNSLRSARSFALLDQRRAAVGSAAVDSYTVSALADTCAKDCWLGPWFQTPGGGESNNIVWKKALKRLEFGNHIVSYAVNISWSFAYMNNSRHRENDVISLVQINWWWDHASFGRLWTGKPVRQTCIRNNCVVTVLIPSARMWTLQIITMVYINIH